MLVWYIPIFRDVDLEIRFFREPGEYTLIPQRVLATDSFTIAGEGMNNLLLVRSVGGEGDRL